MPIKLDCPRCKKSLSVPSKKAGAYVNCPRCNGRFWVPGTAGHSADEPGAVTAAGAPGSAMSGTSASPPVAMPPGSATASPAPPGSRPQSIQSPPPPPPPAPATAGPPTAASTTSPTRPAPSGGPAMAIPPGMAHAAPPPGTAPPGHAPVPLSPVSPSSRPAPPGAAPGPAPTASRPSAVHKKVARFITTEATESTIHPSPDGKLPELRLHESQESESSKEKGGALNPLMLLGALCLSVALSVVLVMVDVDSEDTSTLQKKAAARAYIDANYFASGGDPDKPLEPYQVCLRQAQQAHSRGDLAAERKLYHKVLEMLRAERGVRQKGLTGSHERDSKLEQCISDLLSEH